MTTYKITIQDEMFGQLTGEFTAATQSEAVQQAKEFYAYENDTTEDAIEIISVTKL